MHDDLQEALNLAQYNTLDAWREAEKICESFSQRLQIAEHALKNCHWSRERDAETIARLRKELDYAMCIRNDVAKYAMVAHDLALQKIVHPMRGLPKPVNQCDGCARGLPVVDGKHRGSSVWSDVQVCTKYLYVGVDA